MEESGSARNLKTDQLTHGEAVPSGAAFVVSGPKQPPPQTLRCDIDRLDLDLQATLLERVGQCRSELPRLDHDDLADRLLVAFAVEVKAEIKPQIHSARCSVHAVPSQ